MLKSSSLRYRADHTGIPLKKNRRYQIDNAGSVKTEMLVARDANNLIRCRPTSPAPLCCQMSRTHQLA